MDHDVSEAIQRLRRAPDVQQIAVMPDVHLSADVCIGVAVATSHLIYPQAVGGDIGCGMLAVRLDVVAAAFRNPKVAGQVLAELSCAVPARRRNRRATILQPDDLWKDTLSHPRLDSFRRNEGVLEFGTLGSGNHFIEIQADEDDRISFGHHRRTNKRYVVHLEEMFCDQVELAGQSEERGDRNGIHEAGL